MKVMSRPGAETWSHTAHTLVAASLLRKIVLEIPFLYLLNGLFPLYGIAYAQAAAELVMAIAAVLVLARFLKRAESEAAGALKL